MTPLSRVIDQLLEGSLGVGKRLCGTAELHAFADIIPSRGAKLAGLTWLANFKCDMVAYGEVGDVGGDSSDDAAGLVAQSEGLPHEDVAVAEVVEVVQVGAAKPCGLDGDLDFARRKGGEFSLFLRRLDTWSKRHGGWEEGDRLTILRSFAP